MTTTHQLSPYEQFRLDRIKRNEERLASLGLAEAKQAIKTSSRRQPSTPSGQLNRPKRSSSTMVTPSPPSRSSRRLTHKPVQYEPLMDDTTSIRKKIKLSAKKKATTSSNSNLKYAVPMDITSSPLSDKEKAIVCKKIEGDFLGKFEDYLTNVDTLSYQNKRNVLRQITKLATGEGIRYDSKAYGWPENCVFLGGIKVGPTDDILKLMDHGRECEEKWGEDHGNGWLLSHPLKKLYMFQRYLLEE